MFFKAYYSFKNKFLLCVSIALVLEVWIIFHIKIRLYILQPTVLAAKTITRELFWHSLSVDITNSTYLKTLGIFF